MPGSVEPKSILVVGGGPTVGVGEFQFSVATGPCELESFGTLTRLLISNVDGSYAANTAQSTNNTVGRGGLAAQFTYLAATNSGFNGLINVSGGTFTNGPTQEIGLITGLCAGSALLLQAD